MRLRTIVKIAVTSSVVLLCTGFVLYSFFRLSAAEGQRDFNLYELVPSDATAVFVTDDVHGFVDAVDGLTCSKNHQYLYASRLFSHLKQALEALSADSPHGLSRQMSQVLISFHQPDNEYNQVLYCRLGTGDRELIDRFVRKSLSSYYPPKKFSYKGEEMMIYPMPDGDFLVCYLTSEYMVLSFQKKLVEDVIDACKKGSSLADDAAFANMCMTGKSTVTATIYTRMSGMMGWTGFDMKMKDDFIYFTGTSCGADSCFDFLAQLRRQESVQGFPGEVLPSTAFYFSRQSVADWNPLLSYDDGQGDTSVQHAAEVQESDRELLFFLMENTGHDLMTCLFQREDTLQDAAAVMSLSVTDAAEAERLFRPLVKTLSTRTGKAATHTTFCYTADKAYPVYRWPETSLFGQLAGWAVPASPAYAAFYGGRLLLSPDEDGLYRYISLLEKGEVLDGVVAYRTGIDNLSDSYHFMLMADFGLLFRQAEQRLRFVPDFFRNNSDFFGHFIIFAQFTCTDSGVSPNIVLKYKTE